MGIVGAGPKHAKGTSLDGIILPQVYRRLWDDVARKSRKAKELSKAVDNQRRLEWLKLLLSHNHLHLTDLKGKELLRQLALYDELVASQAPLGQSSLMPLRPGRST